MTILPKLVGSAGTIWRGILYEDPCCYCNEEGYTIDHIQPRSELMRCLTKQQRRHVINNTSSETYWQPNHWSNLSSACQHCNASKGDQSLLLYLVRQQRNIRKNINKNADFDNQPARIAQSTSRNPGAHHA